MAMLKSKSLLFVLLTLVVLAGCGSDGSQSNVKTITTNSSQSEEVQEGHIRVTVSKDNGTQYITEEEIAVEEGENLLDIMTATFFIEQSNGDITSIERVKASEEEGLEWVYYVNGDLVDQLPRDYIPSAGDKIVFDLQPVS